MSSTKYEYKVLYFQGGGFEMTTILTIIFLPITIMGFIYREITRSWRAGKELNEFVYEVEK